MEHILLGHPLVPVIAVEKSDQILDLGHIFARTGIGIAEITFRTEAAPDAIRKLRKNFPDIVVGAGTVLTETQLKTAADCGCNFFVSPGFNPAMVDIAQREGLLLVPGVTNPGQVEQAMWKGLNTLKFFPAEAAGGVAMLKAFSAVYPEVSFMPTGGITQENILSYLRLPNVFACGGTWIVNKSDINQGNWDAIETAIRVALKTIEEGLDS